MRTKNFVHFELLYASRIVNRNSLEKTGLSDFVYNRMA
jgi:hypothetical protein